MSTTKPDVNTSFSKGSSGTNELKEVYGDPFKNYDPKAVMYEHLYNDGTLVELSGLDGGILGNDDWPAGMTTDYIHAPKLRWFAPNIAAPTDINPGQFGDESEAPDDLLQMQDDGFAVFNAIVQNDSGGELGSKTHPDKTSAKIAKQKVGDLIPGKSFKDPDN